MEVALYQDEKNVSIDIWGRQEARTQETRKKSAGCYWIYCIGHTLEVYSSNLTSYCCGRIERLVKMLVD